MALHFERSEFERRERLLARALSEAGLDGALLFAPESHYWLTGYDTFGFCFFQCLVVTADGRMALLTRSADRRQARATSTIEDVRVWVDRQGATPADDLLALIEELGLRGARLGVETDTHGTTAASGAMVERVLGPAVRLEEASLLVPRLRLAKSEAERACLRRAGELADRAHARALEIAAPGADEGAILAAMHGAIFEAGGEEPANPFIIGSGPDALLCRSKSGRRRLEPIDQLTLEWAGVWRRYHAAMMRTVPIGAAAPRHRELHAPAVEALLAAEEALRPGARMGDAFAAQARVLDGAGLAECRLNATGYAMGARFAPSWMDWPMFFEGADQEIPLHSAFFVHIILFDDANGAAMSLGRSSIVGERGVEPLSRSSLDLEIAR